MAVVSAGKWWTGRNGRFGTSLQENVSEFYKVKVDDPNDSAIVVKNYFRDVLNIKFGTVHPDSSGFPAHTVRTVNVTPLEANAWNVVVEYSTAPFQSNQEDEDEPNPLNRTTRVSWSSEFYQEFTTQDKDGDPMLTDAGYPMEPIEIDRVGWIINFRKNFTVAPSWVASYENKVNQSAFTVQGVLLAARSCKMQGLRISEQMTENDIDYFEVSGSLSYRQGTWDIERLNAGFYDADGSRIQDADGNDVVEPWPLDSSGAKITTPSAANIVFKTFKIYEEADFSALPF